MNTKNYTKATLPSPLSNPILKDERGLSSTYLCTYEELYNQEDSLIGTAHYEYRLQEHQDTCFMIKKTKATGAERETGYIVRFFK